MSDNQRLRIVVWREGPHFVAQCLEYDICSQAPDMKTLRERMDDLIDLECSETFEATGQDFAGIDPAPERFHKMWDEANLIDAADSRHEVALAA